VQSRDNALDAHEQWHQDEIRWWNSYSKTMAFQWELTPYLNSIVRKKLIHDYESYLFKKDGTLLDVGCGNGWISTFFAKLGMNVIGIDFSQEQINSATENQLKSNLNTLQFRCVDIVNFDATQYKDHFDSIIVNAFLHHLPNAEIIQIIHKLETMLRPGGKLYLYEPLITKDHMTIRSFTFPIVLLFRYSISLLFTKPVKLFKLTTKEYLTEVERGYTGLSPRERALDNKMICEAFSSDMKNESIRARHLFSLPFASQMTILRKPYYGLYLPMLFIVHKIEQILFEIFPWYAFCYGAGFLLCNIKFQKRPRL
jgi:2-polyprenyl-3-methyl-5-hydroxy-6-metoxy-1,4-benzoquinol methylase